MHHNDSEPATVSNPMAASDARRYTGLTSKLAACTCTCMATKTISIDMEAYEKLRRARSGPSESFSQVIKRGHWNRPQSTAAALLERLEAGPALDEHTLDYLDQAQTSDQPPQDPWTE